MRIGIGNIWSETSTFSPLFTDMKAIQVNGILRGQAVLEDRFSNTSAPRPFEYLNQFLEVVGNEELVGITSAWAAPSGPLTEEAMNVLLEWFTKDLLDALPLDGLLLNLHGAWYSVNNADFEGLILEKARRILGKDAVIGASMDMHGNITKRKMENADIIRCYHTHPHVDSGDTARIVAKLLIATLRQEIQPVMSAVKIPMITPAMTQITKKYPMKELMDKTRNQERNESVLSSSIFAVQPFLDVPEMGWCSVVITNRDETLADNMARELAELAWKQRQEYTKPLPTYIEALNETFSKNIRPVVIADFTDLMTGGGTGDSTWYLKELLSRKPPEPCYISMTDPEAVRKMALAGTGTEITLKIGGKLDAKFSSPVEVTGRVLWVLPPSKVRQLPESMGLVAIFQIGNIFVVVHENLGPGDKPIMYSGAGLDPKKAKILIAKSVTDFREGYKRIAKRFLLGEAPGLAPSNLLSLYWENVSRPIFPLDDPVSWDSSNTKILRSWLKR